MYQMTIVTDIQVMRQEVFTPVEYKYCNIYPSNEARGVYNVPDEYWYCNNYPKNEGRGVIPDEYE